QEALIEKTMRLALRQGRLHQRGSGTQRCQPHRVLDQPAAMRFDKLAGEVAKLLPQARPPDCLDAVAGLVERTAAPAVRAAGQSSMAAVLSRQHRHDCRALAMGPEAQ